MKYSMTQFDDDYTHHWSIDRALFHGKDLHFRCDMPDVAAFADYFFNEVYFMIRITDDGYGFDVLSPEHPLFERFGMDSDYWRFLVQSCFLRMLEAGEEIELMHVNSQDPGACGAITMTSSRA